MNNSENSIFFEKIHQKLLENKEQAVFFWGASLFLKEFLKEYDLREFNIKGIIDKDESKASSFFDKYQIYSPDYLKNQDNISIIVTTINRTRKVWSYAQRYIAKLNKNIYLYHNILEEDKNNEIFNKLCSNKIFLVNSLGEKKEVSYIEGLTVEWMGENSIIEIGANPIPKFENTIITCKNNNKIKIKSSIYHIKNLNVRKISDNCSLKIGEHFSCEEVNIFQDESNLSIDIGNDCMFSWNVILRATDSHTIYDENDTVINSGDKIVIGNHVWLGQNTTILKSAAIANNSIVGSGTVVTNKFNEPSVIIAGNPAKIIKKGIKWSREHIND